MSDPAKPHGARPQAPTTRATTRLTSRPAIQRDRINPQLPPRRSLRLVIGGLLAALAAAALPVREVRADAGSFNALVATFRSYGFEVVSTHQRCLSERNLFGLYQRGTRRIIVCPRGNQLDTLMHEGWHAVQARCRHGAPLLTNEFLRANLSRADLRDIDALYSASSWQREAEARAMAQQRIPLYLAHLESSCGKPPATAGVAGASPVNGAPGTPVANPAAPAASAAPAAPQPLNQGARPASAASLQAPGAAPPR